MKAGKTVGVYERPPPKKWPKVVAAVVAVAGLAVSAFVLMT